MRQYGRQSRYIDSESTAIWFCHCGMFEWILYIERVVCVKCEACHSGDDTSICISLWRLVPGYWMGDSGLRRLEVIQGDSCSAVPSHQLPSSILAAHIGSILMVGLHHHRLNNQIDHQLLDFTVTKTKQVSDNIIIWLQNISRNWWNRCTKFGN